MPQTPRKASRGSDAPSEEKSARRPRRKSVPRCSGCRTLSLPKTSRSPRFPRSCPLLPIRDQVYFPHMIFPLLVGREKSVRALEEAAAQHRHIFIVAQSDLQAEDPDPTTSIPSASSRRSCRCCACRMALCA